MGWMLLGKKNYFGYFGDVTKGIILVDCSAYTLWYHLLYLKINY